MSTLIALAAITAVGSAIRSTWSPCGLSMLSTITPLAERSRGRRWGLTATWFLLGAALGGLTLGGLAALGAVVVGATGASASALGVGAVLAVLAALDLGLLGRPMPTTGARSTGVARPVPLVGLQRASAGRSAPGCSPTS